MKAKTNKILRYSSATVLTAFALITLFLSSSVILDLFGIRAMEGNYVPQVVWANLIASLLYLSAAFGFMQSKRWTFRILFFAVILLLAAFIGLLAHINSGGLYETKTIGAIIIRILLTIIFTITAYFTITKRKV